ncbi:hypothetical protein, partial [uncultured Desulfovibrio sp.]|uniref:hypothetical protein n=1 Tax=uncultured Desulfovibrio sp. TaxID=167968 RepID=UPI002621865B
SERKNRVFPRNDRPYGLKRAAFQTEIALYGGNRSVAPTETVREPGQRHTFFLRKNPEQLFLKKMLAKSGEVA